MPTRLRGEGIAFSARVVPLAQDAVVYHRLGGPDAAVAMVRQRAGGAYDPALAERFCLNASQLMAGFGVDSAWDAALASEPGVQRRISDVQLDTTLRAMADFVDLKSTSTLGHSSGVAELAEAAARRYPLPASDIIDVRRAALVHDLGRTGVSAGVWEKHGPLAEGDWERVRLHPYLTERILARCPSLVALGRLAGLHHERLDGSGYFRAASATQLSPAARLLAAADVYHALTEPRPHRPARTPEQAAQVLREYGAKQNLTPRRSTQCSLQRGTRAQNVASVASIPVGSRRAKSMSCGWWRADVPTARSAPSWWCLNAPRITTSNTSTTSWVSRPERRRRSLPCSMISSRSSQQKWAE